MKQFLKLSAFLLIFLSATSTIMAQKYGHLNAGNLLVQMPETEQADKALESYQKKLSTDFEAKVKDFRARANSFIQEAQGGAMAQIAIEKKQAEFTTEEKSLANEEQELLQKVQIKRQELLKPIIDKVNEAIQKVGKEKGYTMIFDTSVMNTVLFAQDSDDVMAFVKTKLGL